MLAWLGQWLHEVIAVILLAIIVELVLPNKKMLRYTRLVIGLILLLTLLNPVLKIFDKEVLNNLESSYGSWENQLKTNSLNMKSLEDIQRKGSEIANQRNVQSTQLIERTLEDAMKHEVERQGKISVERLDVDLNWQKNINGELTPYIEQVIVTIKEEAETNHLVQQTEEIMEVSISIVDIADIDLDRAEKPNNLVKQPKENEQYQQLNNADASLVTAIISRGWNIAAGQIIVQARNT